jgi:hypothetical protein
VKETLGHRSIATTGKYLHARPTDSPAMCLPVSPGSFAEDFVCPLHESNKGCRRGKARVFVGEIGFHDPTGP